MPKRQLHVEPLQTFTVEDAAPSTYNEAENALRFQWLSKQDHERVDSWGEKFILRLYAEGCDLSRANAGGPFLWQHPAKGYRRPEQGDVIGSILPDSMELSDKFKGFGDLRLIDFSEDSNADDERAAMKVAKGFVRNISMDFTLDQTRVEEFDDGRLPILHVERWSVFAVSAVIVQQDEGAQTMEATMPTTKKTEEIAAEEVAATEETTETPAAKPPDTTGLEAQKLQEGMELARQRDDDVAEIAAVFSLEPEKARAIARGAEDLGAVRKRLIAEKAAAADGLGLNPSISVERDETVTIREAIVEGFEARIGNTEPTEKGRPYAIRRFTDVARMRLESAGVSTGAMDDRQVVDTALGFAGAVAPSDLTVLLTEGTQRVLDRLAIDMGPMGFEDLVKTRIVNDFRQVKMAVRLFAGDIEEIGVNQPVAYPFTVSEDYEVARAKTWGGGIQLGRQALIDDDLGALEDMPPEILGVIRQHQIDRFWSVFLTGTLRDTKLIFHADHSNVVASGGDTPGTLAELAKMRLLFAAAEKGNRKLRLRMTHIIVPEALRDVAAQVVSGMILPAQSSTVVNEDYRNLKIISDTALDDDSTVKWYAGAATFPCIGRVLLRGAENPVIQSETVFETRGVKIAGFFDYNIVPIGYQGLAYNKGEA